MHPDELLRHFDLWERRLRGSEPSHCWVHLEPSFVPLFATQRVKQHSIIDDARAPGFWARLRSSGQNARPELPQSRTEDTRLPPTVVERVEIELLVPKLAKSDQDANAQFFKALQSVKNALSFEVVGAAHRVIVLLTCAVADYDLVLAALKSYFPEISFRERRGDFWDTVPVLDEGCAAMFELGARVFLPLRSVRTFDFDPLIEIVNRLAQASDNEVGLLQILFEPARFPWHRELLNFARSIEDVDRVLPKIEAKFAEPVFASSIRIAWLANDAAVAEYRLAGLADAAALATFTDENEIVTVDPSPPFEVLLEDILDRQSHYHGVLLSASELSTLVHLPSVTVRSEALVRPRGRTKAAPTFASRGVTVLGMNEHNGINLPVSQSIEQRLRHTYVIGGSGTGKSTLLLSMAVQDIERGHGIAVLDPHGDLIDDILARVPEDRLADVILFDPSDEEFPVGFNVLSAHSDLERTLLSSDLVAAFRRLSTSFGDQMASVLGYAVMAFLESSKGGTLVDLRQFLLDKSFRTQFLKTVQDDDVVQYWQVEFPLIKGAPHASILARLNSFLRSKLIRYVVAQREDRLDMRRIMDSGNILLCRLAQGAIGEENAHLLGSFLVARITQAAMSRQEVDVRTRVPFFLYIDEFHHFITPSLSTILSGTRKYGLGAVLAHQEARQVKSRSEDVFGAILSNASTRVMFRVGDQDARFLAEGLSFFETSDLLNLGTGEAIARIDRPDYDFNLRTHERTPVDDSIAARKREAAVERSRAEVGRPRQEIEALLQRKPAEASIAEQDSREQPSNSSQVPTQFGSSKKSKTTVERAPVPGRGGNQHKYLQSLVRRLAEDRGFTVTLEVEVLGGHGYIDAILEKGELRIACEVSVTTRAAHEVGNLMKCLAAGFRHAVLISSNEQTLDSVVEELDGAYTSRFHVTTPARFADWLDQFISQRGQSSAPKGSPLPAQPEFQVRAGGKRMFGVNEASKYLGLAVQTLAKMRVTGGGPMYSKLGRSIVYDQIDLDEWIARRRRRSTSDIEDLSEQ